MMSKNRKLLAGTIALVLVISLFAGTSLIMAHESDGPSNGEEPGEDEEPWYCHNQEEHEDHHEDDDHHHGGRHHHEDGSFGGGFTRMIRRIFPGH